MKEKDRRILEKRERSRRGRLRRKNWEEQKEPMFAGKNIQYEMAEKARAIDCGGIGVFLTLARQVGLTKGIDENLELLKRHLPYHESDHVFNIALNTLTGGHCLDDIELRRNDEAYLDALGAQRIPDPTTEGDFTRRFSGEDVVVLMDVLNDIRVKIWEKQDRDFRRLAIVDIDGTIAETTGECKEGMDISYKGVWGYAPLIISLGNTREPLYVVNRPGNRPSHDGAAPWIDRAINLAAKVFEKVRLRGDTDFSQMKHLDRWDARGVEFVFGVDAMPNLVKQAEGIEERRWKRLRRRAKHPRKTEPRRRPENIKEGIVQERGFRNITLESEHVAKFRYQPTACKREYRMVVLRKTLSVKKGQALLLPEIRYFFYITNIEYMTAAEVVFENNDRCDQENVIKQLKNGLQAMRMPVGDLESNWAYMVMTSLAWTLKAWFALLTRSRERRVRLLRMGFRCFLNMLVRVPCQIVRTGRRIIYRVLCYNEWLPTLFATHDRIRSVGFT